MSIAIFVLIVTVAAFCGGLAGSIIAHEIRPAKSKKRRATHGRE